MTGHVAGESMRPPQIVVGVGEPAGWGPVLRWAAAEAGRRRCRLRIVHATRPDACHSPDHPEALALGDAARLVAAATGEARLLAPGVPVDGDARAGSAAAALVAAAGPHDLLVVGDGPTGRLVVARARSSVAVVRGRTVPETGPVAVGYDGHPAAGSALLAAFESAGTRSCAVTVIRTALFADDIAVTVRAALAADTRRALEPFVDKYPEVPVDILVVSGDPAAHLVAASRDARLVVLGARAPRGPAGGSSGPVGLHLMHHSFCPVLFARACENTGRHHVDLRQR
ncbi:universal stress protein [Virgisporangium ochraceum]|uniref:Universal stress protein n=1 Tax=Virgisporangium ochraceum TaxID=65505 RepID=A0A8J3ZZT1_9ACTN|nr:universal stress protein [Virgisporangium ochraceum]GIJ71520.1 universal stress protein [Virgisporangium ochraceum]